MKKTLFPILILFPLLAAAQLDTLFMGDRIPNYYYWDTFWVDHVYATNPPDSLVNMESDNRTPEFSGELARCFFSKDSLTVIGMAGIVETGWVPKVSRYLPIIDTTVLPEYFRLLYIHGETEAESPIVAQTRFDTSRNLYMVYTGRETYYEYPNPENLNYYYIRNRLGFHPLRQAYLESPVKVIDTFYVSATCLNNYFIYDSTIFDTFCGILLYNYYMYFAHPRTRIYGIEQCCRQIVDYSDFGAVHARYHSQDPDGRPPINIWKEYEDSKLYLGLFPIFDTSTYNDTTQSWCMPPVSLRVPYPDAESSVLFWNSPSSAISWQVSLCLDCTTPDSGTLIPSGTTFANLTNLVPDTTYTVWVRSICNENDTSLWSESLQFKVPPLSDTGDVQRIFNVDDAYFNLTPNPASDIVTALSSFQIRQIDLYSTSGQLMKHLPCHDIAVNIDISDLPAGLYIVRATTVHGMAYARLVVH